MDNLKPANRIGLTEVGQDHYVKFSVEQVRKLLYLPTSSSDPFCHGWGELYRYEKNIPQGTKTFEDVVGLDKHELPWMDWGYEEEGDGTFHKTGLENYLTKKMLTDRHPLLAGVPEDFTIRALDDDTHQAFDDLTKLNTYKGSLPDEGGARERPNLPTGDADHPYEEFDGLVALRDMTLAGWNDGDNEWGLVDDAPSDSRIPVTWRLKHILDIDLATTILEELCDIAEYKFVKLSRMLGQLLPEVDQEAIDHDDDSVAAAVTAAAQLDTFKESEGYKEYQKAVDCHRIIENIAAYNYKIKKDDLEDDGEGNYTFITEVKMTDEEIEESKPNLVLKNRCKKMGVDFDIELDDGSTITYRDFYSPNDDEKPDQEDASVAYLTKLKGKCDAKVDAIKAAETKLYGLEFYKEINSDDESAERDQLILDFKRFTAEQIIEMTEKVYASPFMDVKTFCGEDHRFSIENPGFVDSKGTELEELHKEYKATIQLEEDEEPVKSDVPIKKDRVRLFELLDAGIASGGKLTIKSDDFETDEMQLLHGLSFSLNGLDRTMFKGYKTPDKLIKALELCEKILMKTEVTLQSNKIEEGTILTFPKPTDDGEGRYVLHLKNAFIKKVAQVPVVEDQKIERPAGNATVVDNVVEEQGCFKVTLSRKLELVRYNPEAEGGGELDRTAMNDSEENFTCSFRLINVAYCLEERTSTLKRLLTDADQVDVFEDEVDKLRTKALEMFGDQGPEGIQNKAEIDYCIHTFEQLSNMVESNDMLTQLLKHQYDGVTALEKLKSDDDPLKLKKLFEKLETGVAGVDPEFPLKGTKLKMQQYLKLNSFLKRAKELGYIHYSDHKAIIDCVFDGTTAELERLLNGTYGATVKKVMHYAKSHTVERHDIERGKYEAQMIAGPSGILTEEKAYYQNSLTAYDDKMGVYLKEAFKTHHKNIIKEYEQIVEVVKAFVQKIVDDKKAHKILYQTIFSKKKQLGDDSHEDFKTQVQRSLLICKFLTSEDDIAKIVLDEMVEYFKTSVLDEEALTIFEAFVRQYSDALTAVKCDDDLKTPYLVDGSTLGKKVRETIKDGEKINDKIFHTEYIGLGSNKRLGELDFQQAVQEVKDRYTDDSYFVQTLSKEKTAESKDDLFEKMTVELLGDDDDTETFFENGDQNFRDKVEIFESGLKDSLRDQGMDDFELTQSLTEYNRKLKDKSIDEIITTEKNAHIITVFNVDLEQLKRELDKEKSDWHTVFRQVALLPPEVYDLIGPGTRGLDKVKTKSTVTKAAGIIRVMDSLTTKHERKQRQRSSVSGADRSPPVLDAEQVQRLKAQEQQREREREAELRRASDVGVDAALKELEQNDYVKLRDEDKIEDLTIRLLGSTAKNKTFGKELEESVRYNGGEYDPDGGSSRLVKVIEIKGQIEAEMITHIKTAFNMPLSEGGLEKVAREEITAFYEPLHELVKKFIKRCLDETETDIKPKGDLEPGIKKDIKAWVVEHTKDASFMVDLGGGGRRLTNRRSGRRMRSGRRSGRRMRSGRRSGRRLRSGRRSGRRLRSGRRSGRRLRSGRRSGRRVRRSGRKNVLELTGGRRSGRRVGRSGRRSGRRVGRSGRRSGRRVGRSGRRSGRRVGRSGRRSGRRM